jgi:hypothetical protein
MPDGFAEARQEALIAAISSARASCRAYELPTGERARHLPQWGSSKSTGIAFPVCHRVDGAVRASESLQADDEQVGAGVDGWRWAQTA